MQPILKNPTCIFSIFFFFFIFPKEIFFCVLQGQQLINFFMRVLSGRTRILARGWEPFLCTAKNMRLFISANHQYRRIFCKL